MGDDYGGQPAFPTAPVGHNGLTIRDYFAAAAMQGILANSGTEHPPATAATVAVGFADALIVELAKPKP